MLPFVEDILNTFRKINKDNLSKVLLVGNEAIYIEGVKKISSLGENAVIIIVKSGRVEVFGENLCLSAVRGKTVSIVGKIDRVEQTN